MKTAVCAVVKNEQFAVLEWIAYYALLGFDSFVLLDDSSTDATREIVLRAAQAYDVRFSSLNDHGSTRQQRAYERICHEHRDEFSWIAFVDMDEYLVPRGGDSLAGLLAACDHHAGIALPWLIFGSSNHQEKPGGLIIEDYHYRSDFHFPPNRHAKSIVRPGAVGNAVNPHVFALDGTYGLPDGTEAQWVSPGVLLHYPEHRPWLLHHYFTRSRAHWGDRMRRGQLGNFVRTWKDFEYYDRNDTWDMQATMMASALCHEITRAQMVSGRRRAA